MQRVCKYYYLQEKPVIISILERCYSRNVAFSTTTVPVHPTFNERLFSPYAQTPPGLEQLFTNEV